jgi:membrane fusion protein
MRLAAFPYQKFGMQAGHVQTVSRTPISPQDLPAGQARSLLEGASAHEPLYRVTVRLSEQGLQAFGKPQALKGGMTLDAQVVQERRAVWEWVLEPALALKKGWSLKSDE